MYCIKCGVRLEDTEKSCPLCGTRVFHPDLHQEAADPLYPRNKYPRIQPRSLLAQAIVTVCFLMSAIIVLLCDLQFNGAVTWAGFVIGALAVGFVSLVLPLWFRRPNPVIFVPCGFAALAVYLLYINFAVDGHWFLSFAFPVTGGVALIATAVVALVKYVKKGHLYIFGGACMAFGGLMLLIEFLLNLTFDIQRFVGWSLYPLTALVLLGGLLIFLAINRQARETMERKLFL